MKQLALALLICLGVAPLARGVTDDSDERGPGLLSQERREQVKRSSKTLGLIEDGLAWLAKHQSDEGYWSDYEITAKCDRGGRSGVCSATEFEAKLTCTAMGLLAFIGEGHYPGIDGPYRENLDLALAYLVEEYRPQPPLRSKSSGAERDINISDRAFPALALIESAGGFKDPEVVAAAKKAAEGLLGSRLADGGWYRSRGQWRASIEDEMTMEEGASTATAITVMTLLRAERLGLVELPDELLSDALVLVRGLWLGDQSRAVCSGDAPDPVSFYTKTGQVHTRGDAPTSAALLLERLVTGELPELTKDAKKHLMNLVPNKKTHEATTDDALAWFFINIAQYPNKQSLGKKWWSGVESALKDFQVRKGCAKGSWDYYCFRTNYWGGRVYSTSVSILCLQTPIWGEALFGE